MRQRLLIIIFVVTILVSACSHTHQFTPSSKDNYYETINRAAVGRNGNITLKTGETFQCYNIHISADSTSWFVPNSIEKKNASTSEVNQIVIIKRGKGAAEGFGIGAIIGVPVGLVIGMLVIPDYEDVNSTGKALLFIGSGVFGGLVGAPIGAVIGSKEKFDLTQHTLKP